MAPTFIWQLIDRDIFILYIWICVSKKFYTCFSKVLSGQSSIPLDQVKDMLDMVGLNIPNYKMRTILNDLRNSSDTNGDLLSKTGFEKVDRKIKNIYHIFMVPARGNQFDDQRTNEYEYL